MGYKKKIWKDRLVEYAGRRTLKRVSGSADSTMVVDVTRNEGNVPQAGDAFSAANMNDLEQRIADEFSEVNNNLGGYSFGMTADGQPGYRKPGADTVTPFKGNPVTVANNQVWTILTSGATQTKTIDVTSVVGYKYLTADNFFMHIKSIRHGTTDGSTSFAKSYNAATGILTISANTTADSWVSTVGKPRSNTFNFDVICV